MSSELTYATSFGYDGSTLTYNEGTDTIEWEARTSWGPTTITFEDEHGREFTAGEIVVKKDLISLQQQIDELNAKEGSEMSLWSTPSILTIALIVFIMVKFVIPKLTISNAVRIIANRIYKPAKKEADQIQEEWKDALKEDE
ncbi:MAG: hypothetical protein NWE76_10750 [Candidatus Bathyarchaeota archaeon]|nr:hypothetical protein [Candidatus Bathyarchaeota archaeon]